MIEIFYLDKKLKKAQIKDLKKLINKRLWIDITSFTKEAAAILKENFNLHPLTIEDMMHASSRVKIEEFPDYLFSIFYGIRQKNELTEIDFILGDNYVISHHKKEIQSCKELKDNQDRIEKLLEKGPDFLFHRLLDKEIDNFLPELEKLDDSIEKIEESITKRPTSELLSQILKIKRRLIQTKKIAHPQRDKISMLIKNDSKRISKKAIPYFRDIYDHSIRVSDTIDNYREAVANAFDVYMSSVSNNMNEVMKTLSIIATIALPLTVVSGIYGTNFLNLPGQDYYYGFWIMIALMALMSIAMILYFRNKRWF
jgi:magnesium transporter